MIALMTYVLQLFILRLRLRSTAKGRSFSGPNIRLWPKVKIVPTVQHWTKVQVFQEGKKCGAIFLKVLDITKQLPNLEDDCSKFLWPSLNISTLPPLTFCSTKIRSDLWTLHSHRILQNICGLTIIGLPADSFQRISNLASLFLSFFSAEQ